MTTCYEDIVQRCRKLLLAVNNRNVIVCLPSNISECAANASIFLVYRRILHDSSSLLPFAPVGGSSLSTPLALR